jgi:hypothetical protein
VGAGEYIARANYFSPSTRKSPANRISFRQEILASLSDNRLILRAPKNHSRHEPAFYFYPTEFFPPFIARNFLRVDCA